jgi:uncharacterized protein YkwD
MQTQVIRAVSVFRFARNWLFLFVASTSSCGGTTTSNVEFGSGLPQAPATPAVHSLERQMFERVNRDRAKNNLSPLVFDSKLSDIARSHSSDMVDNHFFDHESPRFGILDARLHRAGYLFKAARENLAEAPTVDESENGLLKSPHHYENLMATDITHIGIGIIKRGVQDPRNLTVTQIFATPGKRESDLEAMQTVSQAITRARQKTGFSVLKREVRLDQLATERLTQLKTEPSTAFLQEASHYVTDALAKTPIRNLSGIAIGAQVVVDSTQYAVDESLLVSKAFTYGLAVDHQATSQKPRLRVLVIVGMKR